MMYGEFMKRFDGGKTLPLLDPIEDMEIEDECLNRFLESKKKLDTELSLPKFKDISPA
jgi:hypothetical protein